ncbi:hypothetical protein OBBRIDRAFT_823464 [Obba rivulosa]|uniref:CCHC-type domain-containing protein n=1 Tax=Obba rivulosa TaxID=1052685 RepID=A0A8E2J4P0_9APHY|nr:hypothetical protein OBBRIDRAFT_823464 [Obba rivulosa]
MSTEDTHEIIDLTASPAHEVIDISDESPGTSYPSTPQATLPEGTTPNGTEKKRARRKKKKRKAAAVEEGEIPETSREQSLQADAQDVQPTTKQLNVNSKDTNGADVPPEKTPGRERGNERVEKDRKRARRESTSRERDHRRRDRKEQGPSTSQTNGTDADTDGLFFIDTKPVALPSAGKLAAPELRTDAASTNGVGLSGLLLPPHVSVFSGGEDKESAEAVEPVRLPSPDSDEEDHIQFLDYDDDRRAPGMVRYFDPATEEDAEAKAKAKASRVVCKNCGAEGEHKTWECPVLICLTCGARDEHSTRSCPVSKTCFACGMKGHINKDCPNRNSGRAAGYYAYCDRCGSDLHKANECPTLWRLYQYVDDDARQTIRTLRASKRTLVLGRGGEGYIAEDEWCYNCGACGHLGDDCEEVAHPADRPREPSAFGRYNTMSGPFASVSEPSSSTKASKRPLRDWETAAAFADGFGFDAPLEVGRRGRKKERARLEQKAREIEEGEEEDDWFGRARGGRNNGRTGDESSAGRNGYSRGGKRMSFGVIGGEWDRSVGEHEDRDRDRPRDRDRNREGGRSERDRERNRRARASYTDLTAPMRETDTIQIRGAASRRLERRHGGSDDRGPRYRGGYSR